MEQFGQQLWVAVSPYLATLVAGLVIWAVGLGIGYLKQRIKGVENEALRQLLMTLVQAAEQKYNSGDGKAKFEWVAGELEARGYEVDEALIESEVYWLSKYMKGKEKAA